MYNVHNTYFIHLSKIVIILKYLGMLRGFLTFLTSFIVVGIFIALIGDLSGHLGCFINLKDFTNGLIFLGIGVSIHGKHLDSLFEPIYFYYFM